MSSRNAQLAHPTVCFRGGNFSNRAGDQPEIAQALRYESTEISDLLFTVYLFKPANEGQPANREA